MRRLGTFAFAALAAATVAAFLVTQHLKVSDPLISGYPRSVPSLIAPAAAGCGGRFRATRMSFYLQYRTDDVAVSIIDSAGESVRTITRRRHMPRNVRSLFVWDGRTDRGTVAADGTYGWRVRLFSLGRTLELAAPVTVRDTPPAPRVLSVTPRTIEPGSTGITIRFAGVAAADHKVAEIYRTPSPGARPSSGPRLAFAFRIGGTRQAEWDGRIRHHPAPPGTYRVAIAATDPACGSGRSALADAPTVRVGPLGP